MYKPIDFLNINDVFLVTNDDIDLINWRKSVYPKSNPHKSERLKTISSNRELFKKIAELYISDLYKDYLQERTTRSCKNCKKCSEDRYIKGGWICWNGWEQGKRPKKILINSFCDAFEQTWISEKDRFYEDMLFRTQCFGRLDSIGLCPSNLQWYLAEIGIVDPPKSGWKNGKEKESVFLRRLEEDHDIKYLPNIFKIKYNSGKLIFKFLDAFFEYGGIKYIIEYKSGEWDVESDQINDYIELFKRCDYYQQHKEEKYYFFVVANKTNKTDLFLNTNFDLNSHTYLYPYINKFSEDLFRDVLQNPDNFLTNQFLENNKIERQIPKKSLFNF